MSIKIRIDTKMCGTQLNDQLSRNWKCYAILVANDACANDELKAKILKGTAPSGPKVFIKTMDNALKILEDPRSATKDIYVIVASLKDAITLCENVPIDEVNITKLPKAKGETKEIATRIKADEEQIQDIKKITSMNVPCLSYLTTGIEPTDFAAL